MLASVIFWVTIGLLGWVYLGYPVLVALVARLRPLSLNLTEPRPTLSIAIAVHDGEGEIADRIADVLAQADGRIEIAEILVGSDGSVDRTDPIVREFAVRDPRIRLLSLPRGGQSATQNALLAASSGDILVLTDAETRYLPGCLSALTEVFRDPRVGCATGRLEWRDENATVTSENEGLYWRYERRLREIESRAGFLAAVTGALLAVRRATCRPVPPSTSMDQVIPLYAREQGRAVVYVAEAVATDRPISGLREQFGNRARTATQGIQANFSMVGRLTPRHHPTAALSIWSHKLMRWATPWLIVGAAASGLILAISGTPAFGVVPALVVAGLLGAVGAQAITIAGRRPPRIMAFCRAFGVVNLAFALAWINVLRRRHFETWTSVAPTRSSGPGLVDGGDAGRTNAAS
jgi:cellulose synthase/poly-beta-1,6-N-acetylglucosamine synthase-like glycosyltransferase